MTGVVEGKLAAQWVQVRLLHAPVNHGRGTLDTKDYVTCGVCLENDSPYDCAGSVEWPCDTAKLVYGEREIAAALAGTPPEDEATT